MGGGPGSGMAPSIDASQRVRKTYLSVTRFRFVDGGLQDMLMQVLALTPEQINALPPKERDAILALVSLMTLEYTVMLY